MNGADANIDMNEIDQALTEGSALMYPNGVMGVDRDGRRQINAPPPRVDRDWRPRSDTASAIRNSPFWTKEFGILVGIIISLILAFVFGIRADLSALFTLKISIKTVSAAVFTVYFLVFAFVILRNEYECYKYDR